MICDSYVRPCTLVRICDECNYGSYQGRCVICGGPGVSDAYYCKECTIQEKDRDGCPKIVNLGSSKTDLFYERKNTASRKGDWWVASFSPKLLQLPEEIPTTASRKGVAPSASPELPVKTLAPFHLFLFSPRRGRNGKQILHRTLWQTVPEKLDRLVHGVP